MTFSIDCSALDFCCGPCPIYNTTKYSNFARYEFIKYGYLVLTNVKMCNECYVRYVKFSEDNHQEFLEEDARYIFHKMIQGNTCCIASEVQ